MEPSSLNAMRQYQAARQALGPVSAKPADSAQSSPLVKGVKEFSEVFESVETATENMAAGKADAHSVVEALATAEVALEAAVTIRNRVVEAYQELLRMPI